jgi:hypothetical protein
LIATDGGYLAAGKMLMNRAGRIDLALDCFRAGWARRPDANALACALEALNLFVERENSGDLLQMVGEAEAFLEPTGRVPEATLFYQSIVRLSDRVSEHEIRDELRDRALVGLAGKLREQVVPGRAPGRIVSDLFGAPNLWPAPLVRDADFAVKARAKEPPRASKPFDGSAPNRLRIAHGVVSAVCAAPSADEIFVGFEGGEVFCFRPAQSEVVRVAAYDMPVAALATSDDGGSLAVLRVGHSQRGALSTYARASDGSYKVLLGTTMDGLARPWLTPILSTEVDALIGVWDGHELYFQTVGSLLSRNSLTLPVRDASPTAGLLLPAPPHADDAFRVLVHDGGQWSLFGSTNPRRCASGLCWNPCLPGPNRLRSVPLSWMTGDPEIVEVAGLGDFGTLQWAALQIADDGVELVAANTAVIEGGYLAAAIIRPRLVAALTRSRVEWLRCGADKFSFSFSTEAAIPHPVACIASRRTSELIVVCEDGLVARVAVPLGR